MKKSLVLLLFLISLNLSAQSIPGRVINRETREPLAYASLKPEQDPQILSNIDGSFEIELSKTPQKVVVSYQGFQAVEINVDRSTRYLQIGLNPLRITANDHAVGMIEKALNRKHQNDPTKALESFKFSTYSKFIIDRYNGSENLSDTLNKGRSFLSEKVSENYYRSGRGLKELVTGIQTAGFDDPVYNVLAMEINPFSVYEDEYKLHNTAYAGPLGKDALKNYEYRVLDTTAGERPAYMIYFKPKREKIVAGLEGLLYLDTLTFAVQKAKAQLLGEIRLEVDHQYNYYPGKDLWFPSEQTTTIRPGSGGKEVAVFDSSIGIGTLQPKRSILNLIFGSASVDKNLYLKSSTQNYEVNLNFEEPVQLPRAEIEVIDEASERDPEFWNRFRQTEYTLRDQATSQNLSEELANNKVARKIQVKNAISTGYYPLKYWDLDLSKIFKFNNYEGIRLGFGGKTNDLISEKFNINGYTTYGFKDEVLKYGIGSRIFLNKRTGTNLNFYHSRDIQETASFNYLKGRNTFSIIEPRFVNVNFFYNYRTTWAGVQHNITPHLETEFRLGREEIWQIRDYNFSVDGNPVGDYDLSIATLSFLWRPFSKFLSTPHGNRIIERNFPQLTGQVQQSFEAFDGEFNFTRLGLKVEHEIKRLDLSRTEFILEGNYGFGELPLTHVFHAYPNNPNRPAILRRFSVAGRTSFETMYFNEFYSDRQAMLHIRHQLRPLRITNNYRPELVLISRYAIGDFSDKDQHLNIPFNTLEHGFSEAGLEINRILSGLGLSFAYRYGAYHLPEFDQNFSLKFTFLLQL
ncbi:carboxypeptidase-like regulatory domain-containing protein [Gramella sp. BOM4]|nr:carboxypeptidase-like regulatory domain-containing protein [Christiangramia bathymodioli]